MNDEEPVFEPIHSRKQYRATHQERFADLAIRSRNRNCVKKLQFTKNQVIMRVAEATKRGKYLRGYKCQTCRLYHLTSKKQRHV